MFILFSLVVMRMSGAIIFNPIFGRTNYPRAAKGGLIFFLSLMLFVGVDGTLSHQPAGMIEYGVMLVKELGRFCAGIFHGADFCNCPVFFSSDGQCNGTFHGAGL